MTELALSSDTPQMGATITAAEDLLVDIAGACDGPKAGSVSLIVDVDQALVVLRGDVGPGLHQEIQALANDLEAGAVAGLPVVVLAGGVTSLDLHGVWLLLELRRAAGPSRLRLDTPSDAVREVLYMHGLTGLLEVG